MAPPNFLYLAAAVFVGTTSSADLASYVKTDTGATGGGNVFPGVSRPFGVTKLGPDLYTGSDSYSGYQASGNFTGFSMLHESGTGGAPKYGVVSQMPVVDSVANPLEDHNDTRAAVDITELGYYKSALGSGITVELGASNKAGLYQYTFPSSGKDNNVIVDVSHVLSSYRGQGLEQHYLGGNITVVKSDSGVSYQGSGTYDNGWNRSPPWTVYFCGYFDTVPASLKTFEGDGNNRGHALGRYDDTVLSINSTARLGAVFTFDKAAVVSRVGVSFISSEQACQSVEREIPAGTSLAALREEARGDWSDNVLSKVTTSDTDITNLQLLYTSLYFMHLIPTNKTGENPKWQSAEPYYDDIFTLWDLFRCTTSLFHVLQPVAYEEYIRSLIDVWRHDGFMPDGRSSFNNGATQGGSNADNVLADAYVKGIRGQVNWEDGFSAMVTDAEVTPPNNNDARDLSGSTREGRGALPDWLKYGYITPTFGRSASRAIEYSVNDFGLYQVATGLKKDSQAARYLNRSRFWRNHWNANSTSLGFSGFIDPRTTSGFLAQNPIDCGGCYWGNYFYEALSWEYSFNAHHDIDTLIALSGGESTFVDRLEMMFVPGKNTGGMGSSAFNYTLFNPGNEPSFTTPFLFNYVGRQDLAVKHSRYVAKTYYHVAPNGLPGNSDAGAMESWLLWVMLGLYPITGQTTFLVGSPWLSDLTIALGGGKKLSIKTSGGSEDAYYVQSLKVNGDQWTKSWVTWDDIFATGGTLEFELGTEAKLWATGSNPPSPASEWQRESAIDDILGALPQPQADAAPAKERKLRTMPWHG